jgi:type II secretory pathway pseudopilin PulG
MDNRRPTISPRPSKPTAFTLIELLVVIGIITVLIGILVPVATGMRRQARVTTTQQLIAALDSAISQYQTDLRDWPGPFEALDRATGAWNQINGVVLTGPTGPLLPTRSEELLLCVAGGMRVTWSPTPGVTVPTGFTYDPQDIGRGHRSLSMKNRQQYKDLMATGSSRTDPTTGVKHFYNDTPLPEFVDSFESPILYVRANKGAPDVTSAYMTALYNETDLYREPPAPPEVAYPPTYLLSDTLGTSISGSVSQPQWRQKDRFILVSAGPDQKFGTADDITNFGQPKMQ